MRSFGKVNPFDVITRRMQASPDMIKMNGAASAGLKIVKEEGLLAMFRGLSPTFTLYVLSNAIYLPLYEKLRDELNEVYEVNRLAPFIAGITARTVVATATSPIEYVRTNMQAHPKALGNGVLSTTHAIVRGGGLNMFRGLIPTLWRDIPFSGMYWVIMEEVRLTLGGKDRTKHGNMVNFVAGSIGGVTAAALTTPFDVIKTHRQMHTSLEKRKSFVEIGSSIVKESGWRGFFRGVIPRCLKVTPASAFMITGFEWFRRTGENLFYSKH